MIGAEQRSTPHVQRELSDHVRMMEWQLSELRGKLAEATDHRSSTRKTAETMVANIIKARRRRDESFDAGLFADPAWDILLELYAAALQQHRMSVSSVCVASAVPATTALRWIDKLDHIGLITRTADTFDGRRIWVALTEGATRSMDSYIEQCRSEAFSV
jgi:DNA-binding MarR family transcriptional regulator